MKMAFIRLSVVFGVIALATTSQASEQDWPQWRGPNRDGKAAGFEAPKTWPKELTQKWKITVGDGVASPVLADGKLYIFSREDNEEILRCLDANTGSEIWHDKYDSPRFNGSDAPYQGPRSSPTVAEGKVVAVGVMGIVNCYDAATGKKLWTKEIGGAAVSRRQLSDCFRWPVHYAVWRRARRWTRWNCRVQLKYGGRKVEMGRRWSGLCFAGACDNRRHEGDRGRDGLEIGRRQRSRWQRIMGDSVPPGTLPIGVSGGRWSNRHLRRTDARTDSHHIGNAGRLPGRQRTMAKYR